MSSVLFLALLAVFTNGEEYISSTIEPYQLFPDDIKRILIETDILYEFTVELSSSHQSKLEGFVFQIHSQRHTIILSETEEPKYGTSVTGRDIGLWRTLPSSFAEPVSFPYFVKVLSLDDKTKNDTKNVTVMVAITSYNINASIPGGCTLTSPLETDPNIRLNYTSYTTTVNYEDGNVGYNPHTGSPPDCAHTSYAYSVPNYKRVQYTVYHKVLSMGDYSEGHMFDAIEKLLTASSIEDIKNDIPSFTMSSSGIKTAVIDSFEGDGVVYNVLAEVPGNPSAAYVPAVTYSCDLVSAGSCQKYIDPLNITVGIILALVGLFLLFIAHRLFHVEVYVFNSLIFMFIFFVILGHITIPSINGISVLGIKLLVSLLMSLLLGGVLFLLWFFTGWYLPSVLVFTSTTGFMIVAIVMYAFSFTSVDGIAILKISYVYSLLYLCAIVLVLIPAVIFPRAMNIISSSMIGSYLIVFSIGMFKYTSLMEILMRIVKNATLNGYMKTEANYSFALEDIILTFGWCVLLVLGIAVQALLAYKREPHFPEPSLYKKCMRKLEKKRDRGKIRSSINRDDERTRLLNSYCTSPTSLNNSDYIK